MQMQIQLTRRPPRPTTKLTVVHRESLTPSMTRVVFACPDLRYAGHADSYVKLLFDQIGPIANTPPERTTTRTYTIRHYDPERGEATIDFVVHGDAGLAGPWAARCQVGEEILARGPGGKWSPPKDADFHLFIGDESALPAIEAGLDQLPPDAKGMVIVETTRHTRTLVAPVGVDIRWETRGDEPYREERLAEAVNSLDWDAMGDVSVFAHGERGAVKAIRAVLKEHNVTPQRRSISGYWALGRIEDEFQAEKHTQPDED